MRDDHHNGVRDAHAPVQLVEMDPLTDMIAFDQLPPSLREAFNYLPIKGAAWRALDALHCGVPEAELLRRIRVNEARFGLSFLEEV